MISSPLPHSSLSSSDGERGIDHAEGYPEPSGPHGRLAAVGDRRPAPFVFNHIAPAQSQPHPTGRITTRHSRPARMSCSASPLRWPDGARAFSEINVESRRTWPGSRADEVASAWSASVPLSVDVY